MLLVVQISKWLKYKFKMAAYKDQIQNVQVKRNQKNLITAKTVLHVSKEAKPKVQVTTSMM